MSGQLEQLQEHVLRLPRGDDLVRWDALRSEFRSAQAQALHAPYPNRPQKRMVELEQLRAAAAKTRRPLSFDEEIQRGVFNAPAMTDFTNGEAEIDPYNPRLTQRRNAIEISKIHANATLQ